MHSAIIEINKVPTVVETWGRWIEESPAKNEEIVLCIPGNPGVTKYYRKFLETIHNQLQCPVWIIGHAGHQKIGTNNVKFPNLKENKQLYNVEGQIAHKEEFFRKYIPSDAKVYLIGHSIGSYISLHLLKNPDIKSKVVKSYFLFPTIENMKETPNDPIQTFLLNTYFRIMGILTQSTVATKDLIHPAVLNKVFFMAYDEMEVVESLNKDLIIKNIDQIKLYYGPKDNWAPESYYKKIVEDYPGVNAELCVRKFDHAFVLYSPEKVGNMVAGWIESDKS